MKIAKIKRNNSVAITGSIVALEVNESCIFSYDETPIEVIRPVACRIGKKHNRIYKVAKVERKIYVTRTQ